jgi:hypothetical protein
VFVLQSTGTFCEVCHQALQTTVITRNQISKLKFYNRRTQQNKKMAGIRYSEMKGAIITL